MCWSNYMAIPIVLKKPLKVYKVGTSMILGGFISLYQETWYYKHGVMPTIKINPEFTRYHFLGILDVPWMRDSFCIHKGYHSYLTKGMAKRRKDRWEDIGIFEIPAGATVYVDYIYQEVVSTDIKYLGLLE